MHIHLVRKKTEASFDLPFDSKSEIQKAKEAVFKLVTSGFEGSYAVFLIADSRKEIDFITESFWDIPIPKDNKKACWLDQQAIFMILNYPLKELNETDINEEI